MTLRTVAEAAPHIPQELIDSARRYADNSRAANTLRAYRSDWKQFAAWCDAQGLAVMPAAPQTVAAYITALADEGLAAGTIGRRLTAIGQAHANQSQQFDAKHPLIRATLSGIRRTLGTAQTPQQALLTEDVRAMVLALPGGLLGQRDRALLLVGFAAALRRSELVGLDAEDLGFEQAGMVLTLRRSKSDQEGQGQTVAIPYGRHDSTCPVLAMKAWLDASGITAGPVFRAVDRHGNVADARLSDRAVVNIVKRAAAAAGLDPADYAGHSLRSGMATSAARAGASERSIMDQTRHRSVAMVRRYIHRGQMFTDNAAGQLGL
jgi:site-specific recombinase XerD